MGVLRMGILSSVCVYGVFLFMIFSKEITETLTIDIFNINNFWLYPFFFPTRFLLITYEQRHT